MTNIQFYPTIEERNAAYNADLVIAKQGHRVRKTYEEWCYTKVDPTLVEAKLTAFMLASAHEPTQNNVRGDCAYGADARKLFLSLLPAIVPMVAPQALLSDATPNFVATVAQAITKHALEMADKEGWNAQ